MKKPKIIFLLCVVIVAAFGFAGLKYWANGAETNYFNANLRSRFAVNPMLRSMFGLHFDGDARADYLGSRYKKIRIEVDAMAGLDVPTSVMERFTSRVAGLTGKQSVFVFSDLELPYRQPISVEELLATVAGSMGSGNSKDTATLYVIFVSSDSGQPSLLGSTLQENVVVMYLDSLSEFSKYNKNVYEDYLYATMLHEFGHQLGVAHNTEKDCLMNDHAEERTLIFQDSEDVVVDFCQFEMDQLEKIKKGI